DGVLDLRCGEQCDDGNTLAGDGCGANCNVETGFACSGTPSACTQSTCGNGILEPGEQCDEGAQTSGDSCPLNCSYTASRSLIRGDRVNPTRDQIGCQLEWYVVNPNNPKDRFGAP